MECESVWGRMSQSDLDLMCKYGVDLLSAYAIEEAMNFRCWMNLNGAKPAQGE